MASFLVVAGLIAIVGGAALGIFAVVVLAIRQEDRLRGSLRFDPPSRSTKTTRSLVGITSSRWD